jgi:hypothetical protein
MPSKWDFFFNQVKEKGPYYNFLKQHLIKSTGRQGDGDGIVPGIFDRVTPSTNPWHSDDRQAFLTLNCSTKKEIEREEVG